MLARDLATAQMQLRDVRQAWEGHANEALAKADPHVRADRFVQRWQGLREQHETLDGRRHEAERDQVEAQMREMAKSLERDLQAETVLRQRSEELGLRQGSRSQNLAEDMAKSLSRDRGQSMGR